MKYILLSLLGIVLLGLGFAWWLIEDGEWIRAKTEQIATDITGRPFSINGEFDLDFSLDPTVTAFDLRLGNAPWASQPDMARVDRFSVSINLMSALSDQLVIHFIEADGIALMLAENEAGDANWDLFPEKDEAPKEPLTELPLIIEGIDINGFTMNHESPLRTEPLEFSVERFALNQVAEQSIEVAAAGRVGGLPLTLDGRIDGLRAFAIGGGLQNELHMGIGEISLDTRGSVEDVRGWRGIDLAINLSGPEFGWILEQAALPAFSNGPFDFALLVDSRESGALIELDGDLGTLEVFADGQVDDPFNPRNGDVDFELKGPDLRTLGEALGVEKLVAAPYHLKGDIGMSGGRVEVRQLDAEIGEDRARISGSIGAWPALEDSQVDILFAGPDFSIWGPAMGIEGLRENPFEFTARLWNAGSDTVSTTSEFFVGGHRLAIAGSLGTPPEFLGADLTVDIAIPDINSIAILPGHEDLPQEALMVTGGLGHDSSGILLNGLKVEMGADRIMLDGTVALEKNLLGSELRTQTNLASLGGRAEIFGLEGLPDLPLEFSGTYRSSDAGLDFDVADGRLGSIDFGFKGNLPQLESIDRLATEFRISMPSLAVLSMLLEGRELPDQPLSVGGSVSYLDRAIDLRGINGKLGDTAFEVDGQVVNPPELDGSEVRFSVSSSDIHQLYRHEVLDRLPAAFAIGGQLRHEDNSIGMTGIKGRLGETSFEFDGKVGMYPDFADSQVRFAVSGSDLHQLYAHEALDVLPAAFAVNGQVEYLDGSVGMTGIKGTLGDASFEVDGKVANHPDLIGSQVRFAVDVPDFHRFFRHEVLDPLPGRLAASGEVARDSAQYRFKDLKVDVGGAHAELGGTVDDLPAVSALDLDVSVTGASLSEFDGLVEQPLPDLDYRLAARAQGSFKELKIDDLSLGLGPSDVSGNLLLSLEGQKAISGKLHSNLLDLSWLGGEADDATAAEADDESADPGGLVFPDTPIPQRGEEQPRVDLVVSVDRLLTVTSEVEAIRVGFFEDADVLRIDPMQMRGQRGGGLSGNFLADRTSGTPRVTFRLEGKDVRLGLGAAQGQDPATFPPWDVLVQVDAEGTTYHDLAASANGKVRSFMGAGKIANAGMSLILSDLLLELFNTFNPFAQNSEYTALDCGVLAFNVEQGVVTSAVPVILQTEKITILSGGTIDLESETLDLGFNTKARTGLGISASIVVNPFIKVGGTLSSPSINFDATESAVTGSIAVATAGLSLLGRALWDRFFSSRDPCGDAAKQLEKLEAKEKRGRG